MKRILAASLFLCLFAHCKTEKKDIPLTYEAILNVRFMERDSSAHAEARFKPLATQTTLPTAVIFDSTAMRKIEAGGRVFVFDGPAKLSEGAHHFGWSVAPYPPADQPLALPAMQNLKFTDTLIRQSVATTLTWSGEPLKKSDLVLLLFEEINTGATATIQAIAEAAKPALQIPAAELKKIIPGRNKLTIIRKRLVTNQVSGCRISAQIEYYHKPIMIRVEAK